MLSILHLVKSLVTAVGRTVKAVVLPVADTLSDCYVIYTYLWLYPDKRTEGAILSFVLLFSHFWCCVVIFHRLAKGEAEQSWDRAWKRALMTLATLLTLGPVVLKLVEIYGIQNEETGARRPTCYSKLVLCALECLPQFTINLFIVCQSGYFSQAQFFSLAISVLSAMYSVQRYTNPSNPRSSRDAENFIHMLWVVLTLLGCVFPIALFAATFGTQYLLVALLPLYLQPTLLFYRNYYSTRHKPGTERLHFFLNDGVTNLTFKFFFLLILLLVFVIEISLIFVNYKNLGRVHDSLSHGRTERAFISLDEKQRETLYISLGLLVLSYAYFLLTIWTDWKRTRGLLSHCLEQYCCTAGYGVDRHVGTINKDSGRETDFQEVIQVGNESHPDSDNAVEFRGGLKRDVSLMPDTPEEEPGISSPQFVTPKEQPPSYEQEVLPCVKTSYRRRSQTDIVVERMQAAAALQPVSEEEAV